MLGLCANLLSRSAPDDLQALAQEIDVILSGTQFKKSPALTGLLVFLRDRYACKDAEPTTEYIIAQDFMGRGADFDPQSDPIVRVSVRRLREALATFYESRDHDMRVSIPARSYDLDLETLSTPPQRTNLLSRRMLAATFLVLVLAVLTAFVALRPTDQVNYPLIKLLPMQNLTGNDDVGLLEEGLRRQLGADLQKFGRYRVFISTAAGQDIPEADFTLRGTILSIDPEIDLTFRLEQGDDSNLIFGGRLTGQVLGQDYYAAISALSREISAQIGGQGGPLLRHEELETVPEQAGMLSMGGVEADVFRCIVLEELFFDSYDPKEFVKAFRCFESVLADIHSDPVALSSWGTLIFHAVPEFDLMRTDELPPDIIWSSEVALEAAVQIAARFPNSAEAMLLLGSVQNAMGQRNAARISLRQAITLNPGNYTAYAVLSYLTLTEEKFEETIVLAEEAIRLSAVPQGYVYFPIFAASLVQGDKRNAISAGKAFAAHRRDNISSVVLLVVARLQGEHDVIDHLSPLVSEMASPFSNVSLFVRGEQLQEALREYLPEVDLSLAADGE